MSDPYVAGAILAAFGTVTAAVVAGIFALVRRNGKSNNSLVRFMEGREKLIENLLEKLEGNNLRLGDAVKTLNMLHEDMRDLVTEGREEHRAIVQGLTTLLERTSWHPKQ